MSWSCRYVGIPYADLGRSAAGCDCWGLVRLVYGRELGIALPAYAGSYACAEERREVDALVATEEASGPWRPVTEIRAFDLLLFRVGTYRSHVGLAIDTARMLHVEGEDQAKVASQRAPRWASRFAGAYRHVEGAFNER
jgi:cell wall-associated NlpC family hydrolase